MGGLPVGMCSAAGRRQTSKISSSFVRSTTPRREKSRGGGSVRSASYPADDGSLRCGSVGIDSIVESVDEEAPEPRDAKSAAISQSCSDPFPRGGGDTISRGGCDAYSGGFAAL